MHMTNKCVLIDKMVMDYQWDVTVSSLFVKARSSFFLIPFNKLILINRLSKSESFLPRSALLCELTQFNFNI